MSTLYSLSTFNESFMTIDKITSQSNKEFSKSLFETILEFDDKLCIAELQQTKGYYNSILESTKYVLNEGVVGSIIEFIKNVIDGIIGFFKATFSGSSVSNTNNTVNNKSIAGKQENAKKNQYTIKVHSGHIPESLKRSGKVRIYKYPLDIPQFNSIFSQDQIELFNDICSKTVSLQNEIKTINDGNLVEYINNIVKSCDELIGKIKNNENTKLEVFSVIDENVNSIYEYIQNITNDLLSGARNKLVTCNLPTKPTKEFDNFIKAYSGLTNIIKEIESKSPKNVEAARILVNKEASLIVFMEKWFAIYSKFVYSYLETESSYIVSLISSDKKNQSEVQQDNQETQHVEEAARIQLDILDECLTANFVRYKYTMYDLIKEGMIKEALIKANPESDVIYEMQALNEDVGQKVRNAFNKAIEYIKKLFATFMEKLRRNFTTTKNYLDKYKKIILGSKIPEGTYTGKDFVRGMYRVVSFEIPALNYQSIKADLKSYYTFFNNRLVNNNQNVKDFPANLVVDSQNPEETLTQIGEAFKVYFGCAGNDVTYSSAELQKYIKDLYDFLYDIRKIDKSLNNSIKNLETMRAEALKQTGLPVTTPADLNKAEEEGKQMQSKESYYFSYINNLDSILEDGFVPASNIQNNQQPQNTPIDPNANMTGKVAGITKTVGQVDKNVNGTTNYGTQGVDNTQVDNDCNVYVKVATKALQAKLTALEFIRSETMKIFRYMVETSIEGRMTSAPIAQNTQNMPRQ